MDWRNVAAFWWHSERVSDAYSRMLTSTEKLTSRRVYQIIRSLTVYKIHTSSHGFGFPLHRPRRMGISVTSLCQHHGQKVGNELPQRLTFTFLCGL